MISFEKQQKTIQKDKEELNEGIQKISQECLEADFKFGKTKCDQIKLIDFSENIKTKSQNEVRDGTNNKIVKVFYGIGGGFLLWLALENFDFAKRYKTPFIIIYFGLAIIYLFPSGFFKRKKAQISINLEESAKAILIAFRSFLLKHRRENETLKKIKEIKEKIENKEGNSENKGTFNMEEMKEKIK